MDMHFNYLPLYDQLGLNLPACGVAVLDQPTVSLFILWSVQYCIGPCTWCPTKVMWGSSVNGVNLTADGRTVTIS